MSGISNPVDVYNNNNVVRQLFKDQETTGDLRGRTDLALANSTMETRYYNTTCTRSATKNRVTATAASQTRQFNIKLTPCALKGPKCIYDHASKRNFCIGNLDLTDLSTFLWPLKLDIVFSFLKNIPIPNNDPDLLWHCTKCRLSIWKAPYNSVWDPFALESMAQTKPGARICSDALSK